jgi:hypothetical protein
VNIFAERIKLRIKGAEKSPVALWVLSLGGQGFLLSRWGTNSMPRLPVQNPPLLCKSSARASCGRGSARLPRYRVFTLSDDLCVLLFLEVAWAAKVLPIAAGAVLPIAAVQM